jgi:hypothetical protein
MSVDPAPSRINTRRRSVDFWLSLIKFDSLQNTLVLAENKNQIVSSRIRALILVGLTCTIGTWPGC